VFKQSFNFPISRKIDLFRNIKTTYLLISIFIQISIITLSTISANYLNLIINDAISNETFKNGLIITFVFLLITLLNGLAKYIFKLFCARGFKQCFMSLSNNFINSLNLKRNDFINKIDRNNFYLIDSAIQSISNFLTYEISTFCSNICLSITTLVIVACINQYFLITALISIIVIVIIGFIQYNFKNKILTTAIYNQNINNNICQEYIKYFESQKNSVIQNKLNEDLKRNYYQYMKLYIKKTKFDTTTSFINELLYNLIYFLIILISTFLIINNKNMNIGQLTFLVAISSMLHNSVEGLCDFVMKKIEFKAMSDIYDSFVRTSNEETNNKIIIEKINSIAIKIDNDFTELENGQHISKELINDELCNNKTTLINNINIENIDKIQ
jgi:ABC-type bacteriocin/lantibiotic exporter with double-glycine peptidase domain